MTSQKQVVREMRTWSRIPQFSLIFSIFLAFYEVNINPQSIHHTLFIQAIDYQQGNRLPSEQFHEYSPRSYVIGFRSVEFYWFLNSDDLQRELWFSNTCYLILTGDLGMRLLLHKTNLLNCCYVFVWAMLCAASIKRITFPSRINNSVNRQRYTV